MTSDGVCVRQDDLRVVKSGADVNRPMSHEIVECVTRLPGIP